MSFKRKYLVIVLQRMLKLWLLLTYSSLTTRIMKPVYNTLVASCFLFAACFLNSLCLQAQSDTSLQKKRKPVFYFSPNLSITNKRTMPGLGFTVMNRSGWGVALEIKANSIQSEQMPKDFVPGGLLLFGDDGIPDDIHAFYIASAIKDFRIKNKQIVPVVTIGIAYIEKTIATNFTPYTPCTSFGCGWVDFGNSNYDYEYKKTKSAGLFLKPIVKHIFSKHVSTQVSAWSILSFKESFYGVEFSLLIGRIK